MKKTSFTEEPGGKMEALQYLNPSNDIWPAYTSVPDDARVQGILATMLNDDDCAEWNYERLYQTGQGLQAFFEGVDEPKM